MPRTPTTYWDFIKVDTLLFVANWAIGQWEAIHGNGLAEHMAEVVTPWAGGFVLLSIACYVGPARLELLVRAAAARLGLASTPMLQAGATGQRRNGGKAKIKP